MTAHDMSSWLDLLASPTGNFLIIGFIIVAVYATWALRSGLIKYHTDKLEIGGQYERRNKLTLEKHTLVLERQMEYISNAIDGAFSQIPRTETWNEWRTRFVFERVIRAMHKWCVFNHIDNGQRYVALKQDEVWNIIQKYTEADIYHTSEFRSYVDDMVEDIIENLVAIKQEYGGKEI